MLESLDVAEREGYFSASTRTYYEQALDKVRMAMRQPNFTNLEEYLETSPVERRQARAADEQLTRQMMANRHLRDAQIMLEEYAMARSERLFMSERAKYFLEQDFLGREDEIHAQLDEAHAKVFDDCLLTPIRQYASPVHRLSGIPAPADIPQDVPPLVACQSLPKRKALHEAFSMIKDAKSEQWRRLTAISQYWAESLINRDLLAQM